MSPFCLSLTKLNKCIKYEHFKMSSLNTAVEKVRPGCWMGSVDLRDAYYSAAVKTEFRKYLRFLWRGQLFQFVGMPNGLASAPRAFTKLLLPVYAKLREEGHECFPYIDDSFVVADEYGTCRETLETLCLTLDSLGLVIHEEKSVLEPTQNLTFLGFELDSNELTIRLTREKRDKLERAALQVFSKNEMSIREIAGLVGLMVSYTPAVDYGAAHYRRLEIDRNEALKVSKGNFDASMTLSAGAEVVHRIIRLDPPEVEICTDASNEGLGAHKGQQAVGGRWFSGEKDSHINPLEMKAILLALQSLWEQESHIRILTDSTTAITYVKHMGE